MHSFAVRRFSHVDLRFLCPLFVLLLVFQVDPASASDDLSFGSFLSKKHIEMTRRLPPIMDVSGKTIEVNMVEVKGADATATELARSIEGLLTSEGSGVKVESNSPDLIIDCQITQYGEPRIETKTDGKTTTQTVVGVLQAVFSIKEVRTRRTIASGKAERQIQTTAGTSANKEGSYVPQIPNPFRKHDPGEKTINSTLDAQNEMVDYVAKQIASYLVVTPESVDALLAVGKPVDAANKLALKALWSRDLENLETVAPLSDERQEAYRLYNIGVANEALAYLSQDNQAAIKYLKEASLDYGKAINAKPDEKYFLDPQNRIKVALEHYMPPPPKIEKPAEVKAKEEPPINNEDIVAMVEAKMDEPLILDNIRTAPKVDFDVSPSAQVKMARSGVKGVIIQAMKQRLSGAPVTTASNTPPSTAASTAQTPVAKTRVRTKPVASPQPQAQQ